MTIRHEPERGHFVVDFGDGHETHGIDLGRVINLSHHSGDKQQVAWMTPDQARELATALTTWADRVDAKPPFDIPRESEPLTGATELALFDD